MPYTKAKCLPFLPLLLSSLREVWLVMRSPSQLTVSGICVSFWNIRRGGLGITESSPATGMHRDLMEGLLKCRAGLDPKVSDFSRSGMGLEICISNGSPDDANASCWPRVTLGEVPLSVIPQYVATYVRLLCSKDHLLFQMKPAGQKDEPFGARETRPVTCPSQVGQNLGVGHLWLSWGERWGHEEVGFAVTWGLTWLRHEPQ